MDKEDPEASAVPLLLSRSADRVVRPLHRRVRKDRRHPRLREHDGDDLLPDVLQRCGDHPDRPRVRDAVRRRLRDGHGIGLLGQTQGRADPPFVHPPGKLLSDGARILLQTTVILILAFALGVGIATGLLGLVLLFGIALGFGIAWSGISTFIALTTRNSESTLMISLLTTFPLLFLSTAVMPKALLQDSVRSIAVYNPITYIADGLHGLIITPALDWSVVGFAFLIIAAVGFVTLSATTTMFRRTVSA